MRSYSLNTLLLVGNNFLHCALNYILESLNRAFLYFIVDNVLSDPSTNALMSQTNDYGETAVDLLDEVSRLLQNSQNQFLEPESDSDAEDKDLYEREWNERIFSEMAADDGRHGNYGDAFFEDEHQDTFRKTKRETHEEWGDRMSHEYRKKHTKTKAEQPPSKHKTAGAKNIGRSEQPPMAKKRKLGPVNDLKAMRYNFEILQLREQYEISCCSVFKNVHDTTTNLSSLKFETIPWKHFPDFSVKPFEEETFLLNMMKLFGHGFTDEDKMKYLKVQRIRWHPDKFLQKCGHRLDAKERDRILVLVKSIAQRINSEIAKCT